MSTNEIIIAVVCAVLVVFSLVVSMVVPRRNPEFPRRGLGFFFAVAALLVGGMLAAVEVIGGEEVAEAVEPAQPAEEPAPGEPPAQAPAGDPAAGRELFLSAEAGCGNCHTLADAGTTGAVGPNLDQAKPSYDLVVDRVTNGQGAMPAFGDVLSEQQIQDLAAYITQAAGS